MSVSCLYQDKRIKFTNRLKKEKKAKQMMCKFLMTEQK